jgi:hypothetical protein
MDEVVQEAPAVEAEVVQQPTIEDRAKEQGWRPKEEYEGPSDKWVSAETFVAKGELIEKIEALGKELKSQKKANQMLIEHHHKVKDSEFKRAVDYLKAQKKTAYENGDVDKIIELDDQIAEVRDTQKKQAQVQQDPEIHPEFQAWVADNKWYDRDEEMRETADAIGISYKDKNPALTPGQVLKYVEGQIKKLYRDKFENPNRTKPSAVETGATGSTKKTDSFELTDEEKQVMMSFVRTGIMSKEDYLAELKSMKGFK